MNGHTGANNGAPNKDYVDYYEVLQISPGAEPETIKRVYKLLVVRVHPDNPTTGDAERFRILKEAYEVLSDPERRAAYDLEREVRTQEPIPVFEMGEFAVGVDGETNRRIGMLCLLYNTRRANDDKPGLSLMELEQLMGFPREHLMFAVWYLRNKEYVTSRDSSDLVITSEGVDYLESHLPTSRVAYKLLKGAENGTIHMGVGDEPPAPGAAHAAGLRNGHAVVQ
jgi:curved DNA-binding protein CbpA